MKAIGLDDLDPIVATAFVACLQAPAASRTAHGVETTAEEAAEQRKTKLEEQKLLRSALAKQRWLGSGLAGFVPVGAAFASIMVGTQFTHQPWVMGGLFGLSFLFSGTGLWHTFRKDLMTGFRTYLPSEVLSAARPLMDLSPVEGLYVDTTALLISMQGRVEEQSARNILLRLNELLVSDRQLKKQAQQLTAAIAQHPIVVLERERIGFVQRLSETKDPVTEQALQQSLQMCLSRLQNTEAMEQNLQRVTAQQETLQQTLAFAQSSLMRMQTTPSLAAPVAEEITQAVAEINQHTYAVEAAVQEVAKLSQ